MKPASLLLKVMVLGSALLGAGAASAQDARMPGEGTTVEAAIASTEVNRPVYAIFEILLEDLGYEVDGTPFFSNPILYQAIAQGEIDYWTDNWFPLHNPQLPDDFDETAAHVGTIVENGGLQGYLVSKEAAEEYGITSLDDFKRPEVKEAFDANNDGKADLTACPPGWGCELVIEHHLDVYELRDHVNPILAEYNASFADVVARHRTGEPVLFYTWTPNYTIFELMPGRDVVWINVPEIAPTESQEGFEEEMVVEGLEGSVTDPLRMGFVANDINVVANRQFLEENPSAETLLGLVEIPLNDISMMATRIVDGEESDEEVAAMATEWIEDNRERVDGWLEQARQEGGE